jgi:hypothetical protein
MEAPPKTTKRNWKRIAINAFLLFHIVTIVCWAFPAQWLPLLYVRAIVRPYFLATGLFQSWDTFAPLPKRTNGYMEAAIVSASGSTDFWTFPRMDHLSIGERYVKERYRKFGDFVSQDQFSDLWPDVARHIAWQFRNTPDPPEIIILNAHWSDLVKQADGTFIDQPWNSKTLFRYRVESEDLR